MDNLKKRVHINSKEFEVYDFDPSGSWDKISKKLDESSSIPSLWFYQYWKLAAIIIVVFGLAIVVLFGASNFNSFSEVATTTSEVEEFELYYSSKIDEKLLMLTGSLNNEPVIKKDLERLQKEYLELKQDLKDNADSEEVIAAMIMNYKVRLQLLERMIYEIHDDEKGNSTNIHL